MGLKEIRLQKGMTQKELAAAIDVDASIISRFESGASAPSLDKIKKMSEILDVPIADILSSEKKVLVKIENSPNDQYILSERVAEMLRKIDYLDEIEFSVAEDVIDTLYHRSLQTSVSNPPDSLIAIPKTTIDESKIFTNSDPETKKTKVKILNNLKRKSFLTYRNIHMLLAFRGYNHLLSIYDLITLFRGKKEPSDLLYQDLIDILNESIKM